MKKCVKCGKEAYVVNHEGECYDCMGEADQKLAKFQYEKLKAQIEGVSGKDNSETGNMTKEEFEKQADFENRMRTFVHELRKAKEEEDLQQAEEEGLNVETKGTVSLRPEDIERERNSEFRGKEFDSHEEMISYLRLEAMRGNAEAKENLDKLWKKVISGMREQPTKTNFQFGDKNWLTKFRENQTEAWKKKKGVLNE